MNELTCLLFDFNDLQLLTSRCTRSCSSLEVMSVSSIWDHWVQMKQAHSYSASKTSMLDQFYHKLVDSCKTNSANKASFVLNNYLHYAGALICHNAYCMANCLKKRSFRRIKEGLSKGFSTRRISTTPGYERPSLIEGGKSEKFSIVTRWFERLKDDGSSDKMPLSSGSGGLYQYILPYSNRRETWEAFELEQERKKKAIGRCTPVSKTTFERCWKAHHLDVVPSLKQGTCTFAQCSKCGNSREMLRAANTKEEIHHWRCVRTRHLLRAKLERQFYATRRLQAEIHRPNDVLSVIIDAAEYDKFSLIRKKGRQTKASESKVLHQSLQTVLVHGRGIFQFSTRPHVNGGSGVNFTIECLMRTFDKLQLQTPEKPLPKKLYLQMDNCSGANKNRFMFAFSHLLISRGVFEEVVLSFLMVGHTHEDIDQLFSVISYHLRKHHLISPDQV